jgi:hypothetical protein
MKTHALIRLILFACFVSLAASLSASFWTDWTEDPAAPIYNPFSGQTLPEDYWPYVVFDQNKFNGDGDPVFYKMWHQGANANGSIALSYSNDGVNWTLKGETNLSPAIDPTRTAGHAVVLYDKNGFGVGGKPYRIWYWTLTPSSSNVGVIQFSQSSDGLTWDPPQPITQNPASPLVDSTTFFFFQLYGPGFVIYNPTATSIPGRPYTFPYVMFYDIATSDQSSMTLPAEGIGLAYSNDGIFWTRFGSQPVLIPPGATTGAWDGTHMYRPSIIKDQGVYHMFYSGSNQFIDPATTVVYAHGLGHASSTDGINWTRDPDNPIFIYSDGVAWRNSRSYTPFVLFKPFCTLQSCFSPAKMWFTGGTGTVAGIDQGIGYATLPCPPIIPSITRLNPKSGPTSGGTVVTIRGANFATATSVFFGSTPATSFTIDSDTSITAIAPAGTVGTVNVSVSTPCETSAAVPESQYTYTCPLPTIARLNPNSGPTSGGTAVTIRGKNFTAATAVFFGSTPATSFTINSDTSITAIAPAGTAGTVNVSVSTPCGTSAAVPKSRYTYTCLIPSISSLNPNSSPTSGGTVVTIRGANFMAATAVFFGSNPATSFTIDSDTSITAIAPAGTAGTVQVSVLTPCGASLPNPTSQYTYISFPLPPTRLKGKQEANVFATQKDIVNILTWHAPTSGSPPVAYLIYRDADLTKLAATISATERLRFQDHQRKKNKTYSYFIVSVDAAGRTSFPARIIVHPHK